ncbi:dermonecrotic toxin domain-containing protein [Pseudomonas sp. Pseusp16]|uniref:dermonecrotic toxin domain-containing protein n=1 Tax=Pseudomonas sp. Pseusp16 TaxID=3243021 RepID=UPI0039B3F179
MSENTATPANRQPPALLNKSLLVDLTSGGPPLQEAVVQFLQKALEKRFPEQKIDPHTALLASPLWRERGDDLISVRNLFESLPHLLVRMALTATSADLIEGEHFLTQTPHASDPIHLPVSMDALTHLLNELAPSVFMAFAQSQLDYWNGSVDRIPRWQMLSDALKDALNVQSASGWDADQCTLARLVSQYPDKDSRLVDDSGLSGVRACLIDFDLDFVMAESSSSRHLMLSGALVLSAKRGSRDLLLMYTISGGYEAFESMAQLGAVLPERIDLDVRGQTLRWRLYEPEGNIFDAMVWAMVGYQIDVIDALDPTSRSPLAGIPYRQNTDAIANTGDNARIKQMVDALPEWLMTGSLNDIQAYSDYLTELGTLRDATDRDAFDAKDIPPIQTYALQQMQAAIVADRMGSDTHNLRLDDVRITLFPAYETNLITAPDPFHRSVETLAEFALHNAQPYLATVTYSDGTAVPDWMTDTYLTRMANKTDAGQTYPQLVKRTLIDDPEQARRHRIRYCRQLPLLLPLLALEYKLKRQGGVDEIGYRQVCQLMAAIKSNSPAALWPIQIRPLAFVPHFRLGTTPDTVANMYIIGPRDRRSGPCLLYRPLLALPLLQFPSEQNMLYAFYQPGELRDSILAWLPTSDLSLEYAKYVFPSGIPSLWTLVDMATEPLAHLDLSAGVELTNTPLSGDIPATLFAHNSEAMIELADRQSTSNAERRWALLVETGWAIFSVASNFFSGPAAAAVWVWQIIDQIQKVRDAHEHGDQVDELTSAGDLLLTLGILLTHRIATRRIRPSSILDKVPEPGSQLMGEPPLINPAAKKAVSVTQDPTPLSGQQLNTHSSALVPATATLGRLNAKAAFLKNIDSFQVPAPSLHGDAQANAEHLYEFSGKLYAQVGARWFQVSAETDAPIFIVDPNDPTRSGFCVQYDESAGRWHWDLKLRLRGGGPTGRIEALRRAKLAQKDEAWTALKSFFSREATLKASVDEALNAMESNEVSAPDSEESIASYTEKTNELANVYGQALQDLEKWRIAGGNGVVYQSQLMRLTIEQHRFLNGWMRMKLLAYAKIVTPLLNQAEGSEGMPRAEQVLAAEKAIGVSNEIIDRLDRLQVSLDRLTNHSGITRKVAIDLSKLSPSLSRFDLEANEVSMSSELCLRDRAGSDISEVRRQVEDIFDNAAEAAHALAERRSATPPNIDQLTHLVDRLADCEKRLQVLFATSSDDLESGRFIRVQQLVTQFHQTARNRLLSLLPEPDEVPVAAMARLETGPSTSRAIGKVSKARPRVQETKKAPSTDMEASAEIPIVDRTSGRPVKPAVRDDASIVANGLSLSVDINEFIRRIRADAERPSRVPADMKDLFDQQAARLEQAANEVDNVLARKRNEFPVANLGLELREGAAKARREGIAVYGGMLMKRKPRETYLKWLQEHELLEIIKDPRGRIRTKQRKDYFQEYKIHDRARNKPLWVAHFHYDRLTDPDEGFTAAHLKFADEYLRELPVTSRQELEVFDAVDNALRRIVDPQVRDLFLQPEPKMPPAQ